MNLSFRAVFDKEGFEPDPDFHVNVIGYNMTFSHRVDYPSGTDLGYFFHVFHDPVPILTESGIITCSQETFVFFEPTSPLFHGLNGQNWRHSWLRVNGNEIKKIIRETGLVSHKPYNCSTDFDHMTFLYNIYREMNHPKGFLKENLADLFRIWLRSVSRENRASPVIPSYLVKARAFLDHRFNEKLRLDNLAKESGVSRSHLCREFKKYYGSSPGEYAMNNRMNYAQELIRAGHLNLTEIALESGFCDMPHFSKSFKKKFGLSPVSWRLDSKKSTPPAVGSAAVDLNSTPPGNHNG